MRGLKVSQQSVFRNKTFCKAVVFIFIFTQGVAIGLGYIAPSVRGNVPEMVENHL